MNRRKFCLASVAAAISGAAAGHTASLTPSAPTPDVSTPDESRPAASSLRASLPSMPLYKFIYDRRFSAGRAFGAAAQRVRSAAGTIAFDGDITALWLHDLRRRWSAGDGAIAGIATTRSLFCLEQLAKDHWMRVAIRAEHTDSGGRKIVHRLTGSQAMTARIAPLLAAADWPVKMPAVLAACPRPDGTRPAAGATCIRGLPYGHGSSAAHENLVSFVLA